MKAVKIIGTGILIIIIGIVVMNNSNTKTPKDFMDLYRSTENAVLVDIRTPEEYKSGHIAGAINVDYYSPNFLSDMKVLGMDKKFFIYCRSGGRSGDARSLLEQQGFVVMDLPGGITAHPELLSKI